jgi:hypothetical protein
MVDHSDYRNADGSFAPVSTERWPYDTFGFGYVINPFYTNVVPLDFDAVGIDMVKKRVYALMTLPEVVAVDIVHTGYSLMTLPEVVAVDIVHTLNTEVKQNYHVYIGLKDPVNVMDIYDKSMISGTCDGFCRCIRARKEIVIRISPKFWDRGAQKGIALTPIECYRKKDSETWLVYKRNQILWPLVSRKSTVEPESVRKNVLRLR